MHTLIYNGLNLTTLGPELEILGQSSVMEPADAPQYRRTTIRCRYNFFETNWEDNYALINQLRAALKTNQGILEWEDDNGKDVINRRVMVGPNDLPETTSQGTYRQQINFSFTYLEFPATDGIVPNTLAATFQAAGGPKITLSTVEHWTEGLDTKTYSEWRSARRRVAGTVSASGKILGNTLQTLGTSQNALFAAKDQLLAQFTNKDEGTLIFGSFNQVIRGIKFDAIVDQAQDLIRWTLHGEFTRTPSEGNYAQIDIGVEMREQLATGTQGLTEIILSGRIESDSATHAYSALSVFQNAMIPSDYTQIETGNSERIISGLDATDTFIDLTVRETYRQNKTGIVTWTPIGGSQQILGILEHFSNAYEGQLFSELRNQRQRAGGIVEMSGRFQMETSNRYPELYSTMDDWLATMAENASGQLIYGNSFSQNVRIISFVPQVNEQINAINWTLVAHFTRFPNESGYAICDFQVSNSSINTDGAVEITLTGKVEAQSQAAALTALAGIRQTAVPSTYVTLEQNQSSHTVNADTDGSTFIELTFAEKYRLTAGQIMTWTVRQLDSNDTRTGMIRSVFSGTVTAIGANLGQAYAAGLAQAQTLGAGKYAMLMKSDVAQIDKLFLTSGQVFVEVEFSYEYLRKGTLLYMEATSETLKDSFGQDTQIITGFVSGPTNAACQTAYLANIRNPQTGLLVLSEKTGSSTASIIGTGATSLDVRFDFVLTLHLKKTSTEFGATYSIQVEQDFLELELRTTVEGVVYAVSSAIAQAAIASILSANATGSPIRSITRQRSQRAQDVANNNQTDYFSSEFSSSYIGPLVGQASVLESSVTVEVVYAGNRWIAQPIPGGTSIMQNTGTKEGSRKVTGRVKAATLLGAQNWVTAQHGFIAGDPSGLFEQPQQVAITYEFLPLTVGVAPGSGAGGTVNVRVYVANFNFSEVLPTLHYAPAIPGTNQS